MGIIFDIIRRPFGWLISWVYSWSHNYLIAILVFAVILKIVLFPLGIKQQKNSQKQAKLRPKENVIRKKYAGRNDRATQMKMQQDIQELYQKENFSPFSGCLSLIVQMIVLLAVYAVIRYPLTYTTILPSIDGVDNTVDSIKNAVIQMAPDYDAKLSDFVTFTNSDNAEEALKNYQEAAGNKRYNTYVEINCIKFIQHHENEFISYLSENNEKISAEQARDIVEALPNLELFSGFNLGTTPAFSSLSDKGAQLGEKLMLLIPVVTLITAYLGQAISRKFMYQPEGAEQAQSQMKMMNVFMPLFSVYLAFIVPGAVSIYWIMTNVLSPVQQFALSKIFPIPVISEEEMKEAERLYGGKAKKKKKTAASNGKKKKSLVYDDDDEYESITTLNGKMVLAEKEEEGESLIEKAPLKDEKKEK